MAQRDVAKAVDDPLCREYAACRGQIRDEIGSKRAAGFISHQFSYDSLLPRKKFASGFTCQPSWSFGSTDSLTNIASGRTNMLPKIANTHLKRTFISCDCC